MSRVVSLEECLGKVPDPRNAGGRRHPLKAVLTLTCVAVLSGARSLNAIAQFGRDRGLEFAKALGFTREQTPCCATLHYLFVKLDSRKFAKAIRKWLDGMKTTGWQAISFDGKTLRGTRRPEAAAVQLLAAYAHEAKLVLDQIPVKATTNEHKTALQLLKMVPLEGKVVVGDAAFCQRDLSKDISSRGGDWVWAVSGNQPELKAAIALAFDDSDFSPEGAASSRG